MYSLIISLLVVAFSIYVLYDFRMMNQRSEPYFRVFGKLSPIVKSLALLTFLTIVGASLYIIYEWIAHPTYTPSTYSSVLSEAESKIEQGSDYLGNKVVDLFTDFNAGINEVLGNRSVDLLQGSVGNDGCNFPSGSCGLAVKDLKKIRRCGDHYVSTPMNLTHHHAANIDLWR